MLNSNISSRSEEINIISVEDPVEYELSGINQVQINEKVGLTFPFILRSILRQDPNVIMIGEIRDMETAEIALQASLTGHLVLSTLHTNDAPAAVTRLIDMGVEPFLLASSLEAVLAQRLVRKICKKCKEPYKPDENLIKSLNSAAKVKRDMKLYHGKGCSDCMQSGMSGRTGIFELLRITDSLRELIAARPTSEQIIKAAPPEHISMRHDGIAKVLDGLTTAEEVLRITQGIGEEQ